MDIMEVHYAPIALKMEKEDVLVLFTDGLTEAVDKDRKEFGRKQLEKILEASSGESASGILNKLTDAVSSHIGSAARNDDITIIVMKRV